MAINNYLNLITSQHKTKPNFMSWLSTNLNLVNDPILVMNNTITSFDINNAVGPQLDTIGLILGVSRTVNFQPTDASSPVLTDSMYRLILLSRVIRNQWDGTISGLQTLWNNIFPQYYLIIKDNENMSLNVLVLGPSTVLQQNLISNGYIVPRPMGVNISYSFASQPVYGYDLNDGVVFGGYDTGYWLQSS